MNNVPEAFIAAKARGRCGVAGVNGVQRTEVLTPLICGSGPSACGGEDLGLLANKTQELEGGSAGFADAVFPWRSALLGCLTKVRWAVA